MYSVWETNTSGTVRPVPALRLVAGGRTVPVARSRGEPIRLKTDETPVITCALATELAELVRAAIERRRYEREEPAA